MDLAEKEEELALLREELAGDQEHLQQLQQELPQLDKKYIWKPDYHSLRYSVSNGYIKN